MTGDDVNPQRALDLAAGNDDAPVTEARVEQFAAALRRLREDSAEAARIDRVIANVDRASMEKTSDLTLVEFSRRNYRELVRVLVFVGASVDEAKEAVAQTLVELVQRWNDVTYPLAWAKRAALNHFHKKRTRGLERLRQTMIDRTAGRDEGREDLELTVWEDKKWVTQLLERLPTETNVLALVLDCSTPAEMAERFGRSPDAVRRSLFEARKRLRPLVHREPAESILDSRDDSSRWEQR